MTKYKLLYIVLGIHILCGILGLIVICSVPETDHIRWNIGYIIGYIFVLSLVLSIFIHIPNKAPEGIKYGIRIYRSIYLLSIIISLLVPKGLFMLLTLFIDYSSNSKKIAEDEQYIIRHNVTASLFDDYNEKRVYRKQGIVEKYIGSFDGGDIIPHKRYEIHSFHIDESNNVFIGHCHSLLNAKDTVMSFPIVKSYN
ncbi:hypothetical protein KTG25_22030 [Phocaeicola vulgatus]|jgi:hypothetical protein|nr:hypothetical protein HMPREF1007_03486 [Bacteroides sp. 4_1_36]MBU9033791.1 hypothetical protein [Phocaeicola vulgatus]MBU9046675.1 hypothetical protein [Phocaeicola vulgatus]MBU9051187.1 hypothetical protein [Phocaeicola vulgatus]MBU9055687.1 hypothetical protein [Phocaeicola vulgatus]